MKAPSYDLFERAKLIYPDLIVPNKSIFIQMQSPQRFD